MKNEKILNAFKAFELKNQEKIIGGGGKVVWVGSDGTTGEQICDILMMDGTELCNVPDAGCVLGQYIYG